MNYNIKHKKNDVLKITDDLTRETLEYISQTSINKRKSLGQYFTIKPIREKLLSNLPVDFMNKKELKILDPGCGTGEFLLSCRQFFPHAELDAWDIDEEVLKVAKSLVPLANISVNNTLTADKLECYDLIVGNPPYYEFIPDDKIKKNYSEVIRGRANIYSLFIYKSLNMLKNGGYLAFVNPPSMNNGSYFSLLREYIVKNASIEYLEVLPSAMSFHGATQAVMLFILRKGHTDSKECRYVFRKDGIIIFSPFANLLYEHFAGKYTLKDMGYRVKTGGVVWNQNRDKLTECCSSSIPLIWSHNITDSGIVLNNKPSKKQYIHIDNYDTGPAVVVNRVVGQPGRGRIKAAMIPDGMKFVAENHVNVIFPPDHRDSANFFSKSIPIEEVLRQINTNEKSNIIQSITGNTQISKTELENLLPFDV